MNDELRNNLSTIIVIITGALSPFVAQYLTQEQFSALVIAIINVIFILYSAKYPNTFKCLGNSGGDCACSNEEIILNEEYTVDPNDDNGDDC